MKETITLQAKLKLNKQDKSELSDCMRRWCSCMRYAYNRLLEGQKKEDLKKRLQTMFELNSRYVDDAIFKASQVLSSVIKRGQNPKKVIFGGRNLFEQLKKKHLTGNKRYELERKWKERRQGNLYSRGDKSKEGNLNLRLVFIGNELFLRINVGNKKWINAKVIRKTTREKDKWIKFILKLQNAIISRDYFPYSVELKFKNGNLYMLVSFEEEIPELRITKANGILGIDLNASPIHIAWAKVSVDGNLTEYGIIPLSKLINKSKNQRDYILWHKAHEIIKLAKNKTVAIAVERLEKMNKGYKGDGKRKLRKRLSQWVYNGLIRRIEILAKREGIEIVKVNPAYTTLIGQLKYSPTFLINKDVAGAYVIGRKALGYKELLPKNYLKLFNIKDCFEYSLNKLSNKKEELKQMIKKQANKYKKNSLKDELKSLNKNIKLIQFQIKSLESESCSQEPVNRWKEQVRGLSWTDTKAWQVLKAVLFIPVLEKSFVRDFSPLRPLLVSGDWDRVKSKRVPAPGAGAMAGSNTACWGLSQSEKAGHKYPSPECDFLHSG